MSVYADDAIDQLVKIDVNHAELVRALVACQKPRRVLEFGFGAGEATRAILAGLAYNEQPFSYTVVDNWLDFGGAPPAATREPIYREVEFRTSSERDFVLACADSYDFIFSDADHHHAQDWFDAVYGRLLNPGGTLIYHDVTNSADFPNLLGIYRQVVRDGRNHLLLNRRSRPGERCERGLLSVFKP